MPKSNYERTLEAMRDVFLRYDQTQMVQRFALRQDETYLFLNMLSRTYRIGKRDGVVSGFDELRGTFYPADYLEALTIYDVLCCSKPESHLAGRFCAAASLPGVVYTGHTPQRAPGNDAADAAERFDAQPQRLVDACRALGGVPQGRADISFCLPFFDFLPVQLRFWRADEEFSPALTLLWDENVLDFLHYESVCYAEAVLLRRLRQLSTEAGT